MLTLDEVNLFEAQELAGSHGIDLQPLFPKDPEPDGQFDTVIYDLDHWPSERRAQIVAELSQRPLHRQVVVRSYHLEETEARALCQNGCTVLDRLGPHVFAKLTRDDR